MAECRDCCRQIDGDDGYFGPCSDHDLECIVPPSVHIEVDDVAMVALHWATRRATWEIVGELGDD